MVTAKEQFSGQAPPELLASIREIAQLPTCLADDLQRRHWRMLNLERGQVLFYVE